MAETTTLTKSELADKCNVSKSTIRRWCNVDFYEDLKMLGYNKCQHVFTPRQTQFLRMNLLEYTEK